MRQLRKALIALLLPLGIALCMTAHAAGKQPIKVVYHLTEGIGQAAHAMGNIRNHLQADPNVKIVVVGNGPGIDFMLDGAKDKNGNPFDATIEGLVSKGVQFRLCNNTLTAGRIDQSRVLPEVQIVPAGVAEVARLQAREGYVYLRP
ncbi:MAG: DsrE family protein [Burkholderiaceae bacterium]